jgi:hypothetical protein
MHASSTDRGIVCGVEYEVIAYIAGALAGLDGDSVAAVSLAKKVNFHSRNSMRLMVLHRIRIKYPTNIS